MNSNNITFHLNGLDVNLKMKSNWNFGTIQFLKFTTTDNSEIIYFTEGKITETKVLGIKPQGISNEFYHKRKDIQVNRIRSIYEHEIWPSYSIKTFIKRNYHLID